MEPLKMGKPPWRKALDVLLSRHPDLRVIESPEKLEYYRYDLNVDLPPMIRDLLLKSLPDAVLQPRTEKHLLDIFALTRDKKIPVTVRGAGTWGYGGAVPTKGGLLIDLGLMNGIEVNPESLEVAVGPGARLFDISRELDRHGLALLSLPSGKGGTLTGWISTGGMGFGTFHHGPVKNQILSIRVITPSGEVKNLQADDPEIAYFLSTEGQMGIIVKAILRVGRRPSQWYPFVIPFDEIRQAYDFVQILSRHPSTKPGDLIVYHSPLVRALKNQSNGSLSVEEKDLVLVVFDEEAQARQFEDYLGSKGFRKAIRPRPSTCGMSDSCRCRSNIWDHRS